MKTTTTQQNILANNSHIDVAIKGAPGNKQTFWHLNLTLDGAYLESIGFTPGKTVTVIPEKNRLVFSVEDCPTDKERTSADDSDNYINPQYFQHLLSREKEDIPDSPNTLKETKITEPVTSHNASPIELNSKQLKRQLKIRLKLVPRSNGAYQDVPEILLSGKYLEKFGFTIGKTVTMLQELGKLIITLDNPDPVTENETENPVLIKIPEKTAQLEKEGFDPPNIKDLVNAAARHKDHMATRAAYKKKLRLPS